MKKRLLFLFIQIITLLVTIPICFGWFVNKQSISVDEQSAGVLTQYFHSGSGTESDPFIITRPMHYYYMEEFFQRETSFTIKDGDAVSTLTFGSDYIYFSLGTKDLDPDGENFYVYDYEDGVLQLDSNGNPKVTDTLNMSYYSSGLMPVGSSSKPFYGSFEGNNLTISNLNIIAESSITIDDESVTRNTSDIGIFGYLNQGKDSDPSISNLYFDNVNIDVSGASSDSDSSEYHTSHDDFYVGFLVGHVYEITNSTSSTYAKPANNVYVNNVSITGEESCECNYGLFGQIDNIDGVTAASISELVEEGEGDDYSFKMNASDIYNFLYDLYSNNSFDYTLVLRNQPSNISYSSLTLASAISYSSSGYFTLNGNSADSSCTITTTDSSTTRYNYSFTTIGIEGVTYNTLYYYNPSTKKYVEMPSSIELNSTTYSITLSTTNPESSSTIGYYLYTDGDTYMLYIPSANDIVYYSVYYYKDGNYVEIPSSVSITMTSPSDQTSIGSYLYYDGEKYVYYETETDTTMYDVTFTTSSLSWSSSTTSSTNNRYYTSYAYLYVDGELMSTIDAVSSVSRNQVLWTRTFTMTVPALTFDTISLQVGTHYIAIVFDTYTGYNSTYYYVYYGTISNSSVTGIATTISSSTTISLTLSEGTTTALTVSESGSFISVLKYSEYATYYLNSSSYQDITSESLSVVNGYYKYSYVSYSYSVYNLYYLDSDSNYVSLTEEPTSYNDSYYYQTTGTSYISDLFEAYTNSSGETTGYNTKNIDFLGNLIFYSTYFVMPAYSGDTYNLTDDDLGTTFYGNVVNGGSTGIVVKIKNVSVSSDTDSMGTFTIYYKESTSDNLYFARGSTSSPGSGSASSTIAISLYSGLSGTQTSDTCNDTSCTKIVATVTRENLSDCAYCAVDSSGIIIARPNISSGTDSGGLIFLDGYDEDDIAYYILIMNFKAGGNNNYIYEVDFEFKAEDGSSEADVPSTDIVEDVLIDSVDYRSADDTVESTILLDFDTTSISTISVSYNDSDYSGKTSEDDTEYIGYYVISITATSDITLEVVMLDDDNDSSTEFKYCYVIYFNGEIYYNDTYTYFKASKSFEFTV